MLAQGQLSAEHRSMAFSWESHAHDSWDRGSDCASDSAESTASVDDSCTAGAMLFELLVDLKLQGLASAKNVCLIAYWATLAGAVGVSALAQKPGVQSGQYGRRFDKAVGIDRKLASHYELEVPTYRKFDACRSTLKLPCVPGHESLFEEVSMFADDLKTQAKDKFDAFKFPPAFIEHPVRTSAADGELVLPIAIYIDGIAFAKRDSVTGFFFVNLLSGQRHLCCTLRKTASCTCGCRKWCTLWPVFKMLHWSSKALAEGVWPCQRHDLAEFLGESDAVRAASSGQP